MSQPATSPETRRRVAIEVRGVVQGVGFRPFVYSAARTRGLGGWVRNEAGTVCLEVQGDAIAIESFCEALRTGGPPRAKIEHLEICDLPCDGRSGEFAILPSAGEGVRRPTVPADLATCTECLTEIATPGERRYRYPFTNCTNCGPRWSIVESLPYDRPRTAMAGFPMCPACRAEYENPADRRFHAQPIACPACGPALELLDPAGARLSVGDEALRAAADMVLCGKILALKGLGGFQLVVDATSNASVARLRARKRRPAKPLALMIATLDEVRRRCAVSDEEASHLASAEAPILLLHRRGQPEIDDIAAEVAPGNPYLGVMLPCTPLHHLLIEALGRPIVCTSGNLSEEPMAIDTADALARLGTIADVFLVHDRPIVRPVDDSVARVEPEGVAVFRRARGYAPASIPLGFDAPAILALGGHLKNTVALSLNDQVVVGPHVGDLDNRLSVELHERTVRDLLEFFEAQPQVIACDLHPDYASTRLAERLAAEFHTPLVRVQHHHAHVAAALAEHQLTDPVLGLSWDGTGYGPDGTVWGGELLTVDDHGYSRWAHLRTFPLPGGERATREPRRSALGLLYEIDGAQAFTATADWFTPGEQASLRSILARPLLSPRTSSMGRLFDAVACLCGLATVIHFEGQAAMAIEFAADSNCDESYPLPLVAGANGSAALVADWEPLVRAVLTDRASGVPVGRISARFHNALAELAATAAQQWGGRQVVLTGGCFQNARLRAVVRTRLLAAGFQVHTPLQLPPGDGGIALGQVFVAASSVRRGASHPAAAQWIS